MKNKREYFEQAETWALDTRALAARSRQTAWTVAGIAAAVALFEAVALAMLMPLKTVQPITLLVDRQTGYVQALNPLEPRRVGADAALTQSLLAQYVVAREGFDRATVAIDYRRVALWSAGRARSAYLALMPATNPMSPLQLYPAGTIIQARVKSVSRLDQGTALVRFDTQRQDRNGRVGTPQPWISLVRYHYTDAPMQFEDRLVNPLGFQVIGYRRDAEAPPLLPAEAAWVQAPVRSVQQTPIPTTTVRVVAPPATEVVEQTSSTVRVTTNAPAPRPSSRATPLGRRDVPTDQATGPRP